MMEAFVRLPKSSTGTEVGLKRAFISHRQFLQDDAEMDVK